MHEGPTENRQWRVGLPSINIIIIIIIIIIINCFCFSDI